MIRENENITSNILNDLNIKSPKDIDVKKIAKKLGVNIKPEDLVFDISGLFVLKDGKAYIRYNNSESNERQRFTIAHELGHFILHKDSNSLFVDYNNNKEKVMFRNFDSSTGEIKKEREANAFAASLLMPNHFIRQEIKNAPDNDKDIVSYLAKKFRVSEQAMNFRLANLGFVGLY